eukprot:CAMPEP_0176422316 /NCGR_PEP_ID=MMETSP0127-20121128/9666_1 /TAXON_ID=938130 /ORGANISM="Platyophrya macrostoma, Strain WH" /LENGTH=112 /DNA_ID=CAMNT_0017803153 /DNA_START=1284 /DNA_END=1622 /DNA_ORIENTATION=-
MKGALQIRSAENRSGKCTDEDSRSEKMTGYDEKYRTIHGNEDDINDEDGAWTMLTVGRRNAQTCCRLKQFGESITMVTVRQPPDENEKNPKKHKWQRSTKKTCWKTALIIIN